MKYFTTPNSKNIIATLRIVKWKITVEKSELTFLYISMLWQKFAKKFSKISKKGFPMHFFIVDFSRFSSANVEICVLNDQLSACPRYFLHILHGHPSGTHLLILSLKALRDSDSFISLSFLSLNISAARACIFLSWIESELLKRK